MTYLDASVALAHLLSETRVPPPGLWGQELASSRLIEYEIWMTLNARGLAETHGADATRFLAGLHLLELSPIVLARALEPLPVAVRTLDALHLATVEYLRSERGKVQLASYDRRMRQAARRLKIPLYRL